MKIIYIIKLRLKLIFIENQLFINCFSSLQNVQRERAEREQIERELVAEQERHERESQAAGNVVAPSAALSALTTIVTYTSPHEINEVSKENTRYIQDFKNLHQFKIYKNDNPNILLSFLFGFI